MPARSPGSSSTKSKNVSADLHQAAAKAANQAFGNHVKLPLQSTDSSAPPDQEGRQRLKGSFTLPIERIEADPEQPRKQFDSDLLKQLTDSIAARGMRTPIEVRWSDEHGKYIIIDGERRFRAAHLAELERVPCMVRDVPEREILIDQVMLNYQRSDLLPYETADALVRLRDQFSFTVTEIAQHSGIPKGEVSKLLALVDRVDSRVQERVRTLADLPLTKRHLYNLALLSPADQIRMAGKIEREQLTATQTERLIKQEKSDAAAARSVRRFRYTTAQASIVISFDRKQVEPEEVLHALREATRLAKEEFSE